ncbi:MAG: response regulator transcription factor [Candidatus Aminicenantes bacterium]|nr:response regulator transcription factor [Candidatus Aminicenantes bacterium]
MEHETGKKILIIDDEYEKIKGLFKIISKKGHTYEGVNKIEEALEKDMTKYDLIILDIVFPPDKSKPFKDEKTDMGRRAGIELLRKIKSQFDLNFVVMFSARRPDIFEPMSKDLGAKKYIQKPISPGDLWEEIEEYLED